ncbi:MAG TPA: hypothetical protein VG870_07285, partial [Chitinophagaceae bacterium]|nr:hypothetical protein [Chitinophagaceae bacterium]
KRASHRDLLVYKDPAILDRWQLASPAPDGARDLPGCIATSSIRRRAQWLHRYPRHRIENLRGNVNTRLRKLEESSWDGALFAAAGLERIQLRPERALELDWMLPAPAQGAILVVCREGDRTCLQACGPLHDPDTALCTRIERDFLRELLGGCSTPISALATVSGDQVRFQGNILSPDGSSQASITRQVARAEAPGLGIQAARELLDNGGRAIADRIRHGAG